jgi:small RNA 2'-O-methyltransferase
MPRVSRNLPHLDRSTRLHDERLDAVADRLEGLGSRSVMDLGCGSGALIERLLAEPEIRRVVGVDRCQEALAAAYRRLASAAGRLDDRVSLRHACITTIGREDCGVDAAVAVETIEHLRPDQLSALERALFVLLRPRHVLITTPNRDYNVLLGLGGSRYRHPDHRFEWGRQRFERWASGVAGRHDCEVAFQPIGPVHAWHGSPTQMAVFRRRLA